MKILPAIPFLIVVISLHAQEHPLTLEGAIAIGLANNAAIKSALYEVESQKQLRKAAFDLPKTSVVLQYGQTNAYANDNSLTVTQTIPFSSFGSQRALNRALVTSSELKKAVAENELIFQIKQAYYQLLFTLSRRELLEQQDSIYEGFLEAASLRYKTGETNLLEQTTAEAQRNDIKNDLRNNEADISVWRIRLKTLLNVEEVPQIADSRLSARPVWDLPDSAIVIMNPGLALSGQEIRVAENYKKVEASKLAPDVVVGFFSQTLTGTKDPETGVVSGRNDRFTGIEVGVSIPLWFVPQQARVRAAKLKREAAERSHESHQLLLTGQAREAMQQYLKNKSSVEYYMQSALPNAGLILKQSAAAFRAGEIGYAEYLIGLRNAIAIKEGYLQALNDYNQTVIHLEYLSGNK